MNSNIAYLVFAFTFNHFLFTYTIPFLYDEFEATGRDASLCPWKSYRPKKILGLVTRGNFGVRLWNITSEDVNVSQVKPIIPVRQNFLQTQSLTASISPLLHCIHFWVRLVVFSHSTPRSHTLLCRSILILLALGVISEHSRFSDRSPFCVFFSKSYLIMMQWRVYSSACGTWCTFVWCVTTH